MTANLTLPRFDGEAACAEVGGDEWFPEPGGEGIVVAQQARAICNRCEVQDQCLQWALTHDEAGIWGGLNEGERRRIRASRPRHVTPALRYTDEATKARVLELTAKGWAADEIAREFGISARTVIRIRVQAGNESAA